MENVNISPIGGGRSFHRVFILYNFDAFVLILNIIVRLVNQYLDQQATIEDSAVSNRNESQWECLWLASVMLTGKTS